LLLFLIVINGCHIIKHIKKPTMNKLERKVILQEVNITETVEEVEPPENSELTTNFKSVQEWLVNLCDGEPPKIPISIYSIGVFETEGHNSYIVFLVGLNTYGTPDKSSIKIDYAPTHMYYLLPTNEYKHLNQAQVFEKLTVALKNFTATPPFKNSFFAKAQSIKTNFGGTIWTNE